MLKTLPLGLFALAASLPAQQPLYTFPGTDAGDRLGAAVASAGDVNADGVGDLVVGTPSDDNSGAESGSVTIYSGATGAVLWTFDGTVGDGFGTAVDAAGDVNGDGFADILVGAPFDDTTDVDAGAAFVFSGKDGTVLRTMLGIAAGDNFGWSVSAAGDVNNDGYDDVIVGAPLVDANGVDSGGARVVSGFDGSTLLAFGGDSAGDNLGWSVSGVGDIDADGFADVIVGIPLDDANGVDSGSIYVFAGIDGSDLSFTSGNAAGDNFGWSVSGAGRANGDFQPDYIVGAPLADDAGVDAGAAYVYSGANHGLLFTVLGRTGDNLGWSVRNAQDVNRDGRDDVIVGAPLADLSATDAGQVRIHSGLDGRPIYTLRGQAAGDNLGYAVARGDDLDGDGYPDVAAGAPAANGGAGSATAYALVPYRDQNQTTIVAPTATTGAQFGSQIAVIGDVDNDGVDDYAVGAPFDIATLGKASIYSGADHSLIRTHIGPALDAWFSSRMGPAGDVDSDGHDDYIVAAWHDSSGGYVAGRADLFSGVDGAQLEVFFGTSIGAHLGSCMGTLGDIDNDGVDDFFIGLGEFQSQTGAINVYSGADPGGGERTLIYQVIGPTQGDWFAWSGDSLGDVNGDGICDFVVGAPSTTRTPKTPGYAQVRSGVDGALIHTFTGDLPGDKFGQTSANAGDVDGDGIDDIIVGAEDADPPTGEDAGIARIFSGATGLEIHTVMGEASGDSFGFSVAGAGDANGDGFADFLVGARNADPNGLAAAGKAYLFSGFDASLLQEFDGDVAGDELGAEVSSLGSDSNGDGYIEILIGAAKDDDGGTDAGTARLFETRVKTDPAVIEFYGAGCPGSDGKLPRLSVLGRPAIGESFELKLSSTLPNVTVILGLDVMASNFDLSVIGAPGCVLLANPVLSVPTLTSSSGRTALNLPLPNDPQFVGATLYTQWLVFDPAANFLGLTFTRGGRIDIGNP